MLSGIKDEAARHGYLKLCLPLNVSAAHKNVTHNRESDSAIDIFQHYTLRSFCNSESTHLISLCDDSAFRNLQFRFLNSLHLVDDLIVFFE